MNGNAPYCSMIGSHTDVTKKCRPNLWRGNTEFVQSWYTSSTVISTTLAANRNVINRAISSPCRMRERKEREPTMGPALGRFVLDVATVSCQLLNGIDCLLFLFYDFLGKLRVGEAFRIALPVREHPLQEAFDRVALRSILKFLRNQQPREARDGVSRFPGRVGNGHSEICRHILCRSGRSRTDARQISFHETSGGIFYRSVGYVILRRVNQFNVTNRIRRLLDQSGHAFIAFAAQADRPIRRRSFAYFILPFIADLRQVIRPDVRCAAAIRTVYHHDIVILRGEVYALVRISDCRIIPLRDLAKENSSEHFRREVESCIYARHIVGRYVRTQHRREMQHQSAALLLKRLELLVVHRAICGAEVYSSFGHLFDARPGPYRLVIELKIAVFFMIFIEPLRINGVGKCCARTINQERLLRRPCCRG